MYYICFSYFSIDFLPDFVNYLTYFFSVISHFVAYTYTYVPGEVHGDTVSDSEHLIGYHDKNISLDDMTLDEYKAISSVFEEDIYEAISLKTCVEKRLTKGAPGHAVMLEEIKECEKYLEV